MALLGTRHCFCLSTSHRASPPVFRIKSRNCSRVQYRKSFYLPFFLKKILGKIHSGVVCCQVGFPLRPLSPCYPRSQKTHVCQPEITGTDPPGPNKLKPPRPSKKFIKWKRARDPHTFFGGKLTQNNKTCTRLSAASQQQLTSSA